VRELVESGHLGGAAFDVFEREPVGVDHPLVGHDNIVVTPHLGASTHEAQDNVGRELAEQLVTFFRTGRVLNRVEAR
jgi:D-3-phosphoglycerate dehydrogenase